MYTTPLVSACQKALTKTTTVTYMEVEAAALFGQLGVVFRTSACQSFWLQGEPNVALKATFFALDVSTW